MFITVQIAHWIPIQVTTNNDEKEVLQFYNKRKLHPAEANVLAQALTQPAFRDNFVNNVTCKVRQYSDCDDSKVVINFGLEQIPSFIDISWCRLIISLVRVKTEVEEALALLSTIGGAYSCLGERDQQCAEKAGMIAFRQLKLSTIRGDPNLVARCFIYRVYSLCQLHEKREATKLMKRVIYPLLKKMVFTHCCDEAVKNMYKAACHRIRYLTISNKG